VFFTATILLAYDMILEPLAPQLKMWNWENGKAPFQNYLAWFVIALIFAALVKISGINMKNRIAPVILICQILFFTIILIT
jgi:putative membrane protein